MNDIEKILTGGGMVFKKKGKDENAGEKRLSFQIFCVERINRVLLR